MRRASLDKSVSTQSFLDTRRLRRSLLVGVPLWCATVDFAAAACSTNAPTAGQTVTCTGADTVGVTPAAGTSNVTVDVLQGASITGVNRPAGGVFTNYSSIYVFDNGVVNNAGAITPNPSQVSGQTTAVGVSLNGSNTTLNNTGSITVSNPTTISKTLYGAIATVPDAQQAAGVTYSNVSVQNYGSIALTQSANQTARGVYAGEAIDSMTIDNYGSISVTKVGNATGNRANAGIDADDDTDTLVVHNHAGATISATGGNTFGVGGRAQDYTLTNDGTIAQTGTLTYLRNTSLAAVPTIAATAVPGGAAILIYGPGDATVDNTGTGTIKGDVWLTDLSPIAPNAGQGGQDYSRNSVFTNEGMIAGSFHYGNGTHELTNTGTITGNIAVDQRVPISAANGAIPTGTITPGNAAFTLTNSGAIGGDITILDRAESVNAITLMGTGFSGNVTTTGLGSSTLTLRGVTNLQSVQNFSTLNLTRSNVAIANGVSLVDDATIRTTIYGRGGSAANPTTNLGSIQGALTLQGDTTILPRFAAVLHDGDVYRLASNVTSAGDINVRRTALVSFTPNTGSGALDLRTNVRPGASFAGITTPGAQTIDGLTSYRGSNGQVQALGTTIESLRSGAQVAAAGRALAPITNGADIQIPINSVMLFHQQIDARLDTFIYDQIPVSGRSADLGVVRPVAVIVPANAGWIEGIGGGVHQSTHDGVTGYNADLTGVIGGYDRLIAPAFRVGGAFGFIDGNVNGNINVGGRRENIQTYQGLGYATYEGPRVYLRGSAGYGGVNFHDTRSIAFANFNDITTGAHSGDIFTTRGEGGVPIASYGGLVIPYGAFTYSRLHQNGYHESSLNGAGLGYAALTNNSDRSEVGGKVLVPIGGSLIFNRLFPVGAEAAIEGRAAYVHEFGDVNQSVSASFTGGNSFLVTGPNPSRDMLDYAVGLRVASGPAQIDISYNGLARSTYLQQIGLLRLRYVF